MTNRENVEALQGILEEVAPDGVASWGMGQLAAKLAAAGVLVPSALTDEQTKSATDEGGMMVSDYEMEYTPEEFRLALTNLAKAGTVGLPWARPAGQRLRSGDNVAVDPMTGKLVRWRNGLTHFCYARKDVAVGEILTSDEASCW